MTQNTEEFSPGLMLTIYQRPVLRLRKSTTVLPVHHMPSSHAQGHLYLLYLHLPTDVTVPRIKIKLVFIKLPQPAIQGFSDTRF
jgi:hypothetical protein